MDHFKMLKELIIHQWKSIFRSPNLGRDTRSNIFIGILLILMLLNFFLLGLFLDELLAELYPGKDPVTLVNGFILFYLLIDLLVRLILQAVPGLSIQPYLHLNIKKGSLAHYLLLKSLGSVFNYIPFAIILPFSIGTLSKIQYPVYTFCWILGIFLFLLFNAYLAIYVKRRTLDKPILEIVLGIIIIGLIALDYFNYFSLSSYSVVLFKNLMTKPIFLVLPLMLLCIMYVINFHWVKGKLYLEQLEKRKSRDRSSYRGFSFLDRWGEVGFYMQLELKLIVRNKRLKQGIPGSLAMLLLGFVIYGYEEYQNMTFFLIYMGVLFIGMFMLYYGQFAFAWESHYFDKILSEKINMNLYIKAKYRIMQVTCLVLYILLLPYALYSEMILFVNSAILLFNLGINSLYLLWTGTSNRERLDLEASYFTWQGKKGRQIGIVFLMIIYPLVIYVPFKIIGNEYVGLIAVGLAGLVGLVYGHIILNKITEKMLRIKYDMAAGFREGF